MWHCGQIDPLVYISSPLWALLLCSECQKWECYYNLALSYISFLAIVTHEKEFK